jgi:hypothetical protein
LIYGTLIMAVLAFVLVQRLDVSVRLVQAENA